MQQQQDAPRSAHPIEELTTGERLVLAILDHQVVRIRYQGRNRTVEPHLLGIHEPILVAYQTAGGSESGDVPGWRSFISTAMDEVELVGQHFPGPRSDLNAAAQPMIEIFARA
jgi:predicted DNA-binding transcriptional regulator YafY